MYRPPFADGINDIYNFDYGNGPIGLINNDHRRRPVRGRRTLRNQPPRPIQRPSRPRPNSATHGHCNSTPNNKTRADVHVNTTNNNATSQNRPCKSASGVTVINKVHVQDANTQKQHIPSTTSNDNTNCETVVLGPGQPTEVSNIQLNITTTIQRKEQVDDTSSTNIVVKKPLDHNGDCPERTQTQNKDKDFVNVKKSPDANNLNVPEKSDDNNAPDERGKQRQTTASTNSFNEIYLSLEKCRLAENDTPEPAAAAAADLNKFPKDPDDAPKDEWLSTDSLPALIEKAQLPINIPPGSTDDHLKKDANIGNQPESTGVCQPAVNNCNKDVVTDNSNFRSTWWNDAPTEKHALRIINEETSETVFPEEEQTDVTGHKSLQIFANDPAAVVASIHGTVFSQCRGNEATTHVLNKSLSTTSQYPTNPAHLMEQLTIVKMHRDIVVDTLEDKKTEVSRLWERLDVMKGASDRLLLSNNNLCSERDSLQKQLEISITEKENTEKKIDILNEKLTTAAADVTTNTMAVQTDQVKDDEKESLRSRILKLQNVVSHKDNRIREIADNANRANQKLRNDVDRYRNSLAALQEERLMHRVMQAGPSNGKTDICERTDRRDKLIAELPQWNYISPCDLNPIIRLGEKHPVVVGKGVFGKVDLMQFLPTRTLVAVKTVYLDVNAPEKTRNHIRLKFQCEVRAMQVTSTHYAFPFLLGVVDEGMPSLRLVAQFLGDHKTLESTTISRVLKSGQQGITKSHWLSILFDVIVGLKFMHENYLLHNDLKGDNILVVFVQHCRWAGRIIDLGQVSSLNHPQEYRLCEEEKARFRKNHTHIAPELVAGTHKESTASDVFQIGLIIKEVGSKLNIKPLESLGVSCLNKDPFNRPTITTILANEVFDSLKDTQNWYKELRT